MKYLVLYHQEIRTGFGQHDNEITSPLAFWEELDTKEDAIAIARDKKGVIVEVFEFDIKKEQK